MNDLDRRQEAVQLSEEEFQERIYQNCFVLQLCKKMRINMTDTAMIVIKTLYKH